MRQTRNRVERELKQRRRRVETTVKQNRSKAEDSLKRAQTAVSGARLDAGLGRLARAASRGGAPGGICPQGRSIRVRGAAAATLPSPRGQHSSLILPRFDRPQGRIDRVAGPPCDNQGQWPLPTKEQVTEALTAVIDPELRRSIVELGMVRSIEIARRAARSRSSSR